MSMWQAVAVGLIPSIAVGLLFWYVMRAVVRADRNERAALAAMDEAEAASAAASQGRADAGEPEEGASPPAPRTTPGPVS